MNQTEQLETIPAENKLETLQQQKRSDPRAQITRRGLWIAAWVVLLGIGGAWLSVWGRKAITEETTKFFGADAILAYQLAEEIELYVDQRIVTPANKQPAKLPPLEPAQESLAALVSEQTDQVRRVRLSGMPGLAHLRHDLLDDRAYDWQSVSTETIAETTPFESRLLLRFTDPTANRFEPITLLIDLERGRCGRVDANRTVGWRDGFATSIPGFLKRVAHFEPIRSEAKSKQ